MINPIIHFDQLAPRTDYNICASCQGINEICKEIKTSSMVMILSNTKKNNRIFFNDRDHRSILNLILVNIKISCLFLIKFFLKSSAFSRIHLQCCVHINISYNFCDFVSHSIIDYDLLYITTTIALYYLDGLLFCFAIVNLHDQM